LAVDEESRDGAGEELNEGGGVEDVQIEAIIR